MSNPPVKLDWSVLLPAKEAVPPEEVEVVGTAAVGGGGGGQWGHLSDQKLHEMIDRYLLQITSGFAAKLPDKGIGFRATFRQLQSELDSRKLGKCRRRKEDAEESAEAGRPKNTKSSGRREMSNPRLKLDWSVLLRAKEAGPPAEVEVEVVELAAEEGVGGCGGGQWGHLSDQKLHEMIDRYLGQITSGFAAKLPDKGVRFRATVRQLQSELNSRKLGKCRRRKEQREGLSDDVLNVFRRTHTMRDEFIDERFANAVTVFTELRARYQIQDDGIGSSSSQPDSYRVWDDVVGRKKGRVYGVGLETSIYAPDAGVRRPSLLQPETLEEIEQMKQQLTKYHEREERVRREHEEREQRMQAKLEAVQRQQDTHDERLRVEIETLRRQQQEQDERYARLEQLFLSSQQSEPTPHRTSLSLTETNIFSPPRPSFTLQTSSTRGRGRGGR